jgi:hypothetical protein
MTLCASLLNGHILWMKSEKKTFRFQIEETIS